METFLDNLSTWLSTFGIVFAIVDPFGYIPMFLAMTHDDSPEKRKLMLKRACFAAFVVLTAFALLGSYILSFFGITISALQISGGILLAAVGWDMVHVNPIPVKISKDEQTEGAQKADISIVPLAIPMLSGPASMATVVVLTSKAEGFADYLVVLASVVVTLVFTYFILRSSERIRDRIGITGLHVLTRVMGLLLLAIAVQLVINGYKAI